MHTIKKLKNKALALVLTTALALPVATGAVGLLSGSAARADEDIKEYEPTSVGISNEHFTNSSGSYPATPNSWSGSAAVEGATVGGVVSGVIDLSDAYFNNNVDGKTSNELYELSQYPEFGVNKDKPQTIFGANSKYKGSDEKALLVNTKPGAEVAYAYTSSDMSFSPNSFYRVSTWVKTGDFAQDTGATVKLTGLNQSVAFHNINTVKNLKNTDGDIVLNESNKYGWVKYTFYVRTSAAYTRSVKLSLGIGDAADDDEKPTGYEPRAAHGYALFDTVSAERISAHDFATETMYFTQTDVENVYSYNALDGHSIAVDLYEPTSFTANDGMTDVEIGTFSSGFENYWQTNVRYDEYSEDIPSTGVGSGFIYNSESIIPDLESDDNLYGFSQNPWAPLGRAEHSTVLGGKTHPMLDGTNANILIIENPENAAYGVASPTVTIKRNRYYRFSVWVKGDNLEGTAGIGILVKGKRNDANNFRKLGEYSGLTGDSADTAHYGWKQQVVYIKGSSLYDYTVKFELWLGTPSSKAKGLAMFDNVCFDELLYSEYTEMSSADSGNVISDIDTASADTGIANGNFDNVGDYEDELKFPAPVAEWTYITPDTAETKGFSAAEVNTDKAVYGILPTDDEMFDKTSASGAIPSVINPSTMAPDLTNVMLLSSTAPTAIAYRSPAITVSSGSAYRITADLAVNNIDGYGASLVLKTTAGNVISTIQGIKDTYNAFHTYTFHINAPLSGQTLYLEVWLGLGDRKDNTSRLSSGNVYVKRVGIEDWTAAEGSTLDAEYKVLLDKYKHDITVSALRDRLDYGVYAFGAPTLDYYDIYSYAETDEPGVPYQWNRSSANFNIKGGLINADDPRNNNIAGLDTTDLSGNILYIHNLDISRTTYTYDNTVTFEANKYYKLDVDVRVDVTDAVRKDETTVGAVLKLTGSKATEFSNIKDTTTVIAKDADGNEILDRESFQTYSFYIATGENGGDIGLEIVFGGTDRASYVQGKLFVKNIALSEIDNLIFEEAEKDTDNDRIRTATLSEADETEEDTDNTEAASSEIQWWIIPTVIFSAALLAVIIIILVIKLREYVAKKRKKKITYSTEYDRSNTIRDIERLQAQNANDENGTAVPELEPADELDDDAPEAAEPEEAAEEQSDAAPTEESTSEDTAAEEKPADVKKSDYDDLDD
ncbi:MAG: hypothetical protein OSJ83_06095 [Clostridia bacterium]|nr:hypothetical protein [Clostridia bacterium]